eukprot:11050276-Lingulodinium_polyedra.AAC.1
MHDAAMHCFGNAGKCHAVQCNGTQCNAMQCNAMQCNAMLCNALHSTAWRCSTALNLQCPAMYGIALRRNAMQRNT